MASRQHELDKAASQLIGEIQQQAGRFAQDLFPQGPAGHKVLPREALLEMVANNWPDKSFRIKLLERMTPPGPNGLPAVEEGIDAFIKLYTDAVLKRDNAWQDEPKSEAGATRMLPPDSPIPQPLDSPGVSEQGAGGLAAPVVPPGPTGAAPPIPPPPAFPGAA
jgi:hypothetical protein